MCESEKNMNKLFNNLVNEGLLNSWAEMLDWLFDDNRFSAEDGWTIGYVGAFIKKVKRMHNFKSNNYQYGAIKNLKFPSTDKREPIIIHSKGKGESRDLIRHIRNGIAHGRTKISRLKGELYIEIFDYNKDGQRTAYIFISLGQLQLIYKAYTAVKKSKENAKKTKKRY